MQCSSSIGGTCTLNPDGSETWTYNAGRGSTTTVTLTRVITVECDGCAVTCTTQARVTFTVPDQGNCNGVSAGPVAVIAQNCVPA